MGKNTQMGRLMLYDDTALYKPISKSTDLSDFQSDINIFHNWFHAPQQSTDWAGFIS